MTRRLVAMNCLSSRSGGALAYIRNVAAPLAAELWSRNHELHLILRPEQEVMVAGVDHLTPVVAPVAGREGWRRHLWELDYIPKLVQERSVDVLFTPYQIGVSVKRVASVGMLRNMEPVFHGRYRYTFRSRLRNAILASESKRFLRGVDRVIAVSQFAAVMATERLGLPASRMTVVYHGRDEAFGPVELPDDLRLLADRDVAPPYILTCGSLLPYRRLEDVIAAYEVAGAGSDMPPLVIAGSGTDARYRRLIDTMIAASRKADRIRLLGHVDPRTMRALYRHCRCVVLATEVEACPNIAIEALTSGSHIIAADVPVLREMLGEGARFYPPRDTMALAAALSETLHEDGKPDGSVPAAIEAAKRFSWQRCAYETAEVLANVRKDH